MITVVNLILVTHLFYQVKSGRIQDDNYTEPPLDNKIPNDYSQYPTEYDFIVVGAGTSGSMIASRLAEISTWTVLLVEAGYEPSNISYIPEYRTKLWDSSMDWGFRSEKQRNMFQSLKEETTRIPCGKTMGGSSQLHSLYYTRGDVRDYDEWGYETFQYKNILKYFKKSEFIIDRFKLNNFHGTNGPFKIRPSPHIDNNFKIVGEACQHSYNVSHVEDMNTGSTLGYGTYDLYMDENGLRVSSYSAYIQNKYKKYANLFIMRNGFVTNLNFNEQNTDDRGASNQNETEENTEDSYNEEQKDDYEEQENNEEQGYYSEDEQYLRIDPNKNEQQNISVKKNNINIKGYGSKTKAKSSTSSKVKPNEQKTKYANDPNVDTIADKTIKVNTVEIRIGNFTSTNIFKPKVLKEIILTAGTINTPKILLNSGVGPSKYIKKKNITLVKDLPVGENYHDHVHFHGLLFTSNDNITTENKFYGGGAGILMSMLADPSIPNIEYQIQKINKNSSANNVIYDLNNRNVETQLNHILKESSIIRIKPSLLRPKSRGTITLGDNNTIHDSPKIHGGYLTHEEDILIMVDAILKIETLQSSEVFKKNGYQIIILNYSGTCDSILHSIDPKLYWLCALTHVSNSNWHPMGTCKLGDVVDEKLKMKGFGNIRIADASIIPVMSAHPNAAVAMLAEYVSDTIKYKYNSAAHSMVPLEYSKVQIISFLLIMIYKRLSS